MEYTSHAAEYGLCPLKYSGASQSGVPVILSFFLVDKPKSLAKKKVNNFVRNELKKCQKHVQRERTRAWRGNGNQSKCFWTKGNNSDDKTSQRREGRIVRRGENLFSPDSHVVEYKRTFMSP